jgi:hypothetical protein
VGVPGESFALVRHTFILRIHAMNTSPALRRSVFILALTLVSSACAKEPTRLVTQARQAEQAARAEGAAEYAPDALLAAEQAGAALDAALQAQHERLFFQRSYDDVRVLTRAYAEAAEKATAEAAVARVEAQRHAVAVIQQLRTPLEQLRARVGSGGSGGPLTSELDAAQAHVDAANSALGERHYRDAESHAAAAREILHRVVGDGDQHRGRPAR